MRAEAHFTARYAASRRHRLPANSPLFQSFGLRDGSRHCFTNCSRISYSSAGRWGNDCGVPAQMYEEAGARQARTRMGGHRCTEIRDRGGVVVHM